MKVTSVRFLVLVCLLVLPVIVAASDTVPNEVQLPGTQPKEVSNFEAPNKCDNCHAGYNEKAAVGEPQDEPATGWRGAAMGNAGRDPIFWATMAIAEQGFDGVGDLCIRCHSTGGWYGGRSTPTDASGLAASDSDGVDCDTCHSMTDPDDSEHLGVMNPPFVAHCNGTNASGDLKCTGGEGFYGSGITSMWGASDKLGPYTEEDASARHQAMKSEFHRSVDFCGTCHDVSNSVVGDLASNHGVPLSAAVVASSQDVANCNGTTLPNGACLGGDIEDKAAFNNPPYAYGVVERTFSEYKASALSETLVSNFPGLPENLQVAGGSIETTYQAALLAGQGGNYADGTDRFFSCQSCHMRPVVSAGANKRGVKLRTDLPQHDHTGGNYWLADMIKYQDLRGQLRLGGDLSSTQLTAIDLGQLRAVKHLQQAASLQLVGNTLRVINLTGHKLITGYPEGRRMWLNIKWYDANNALMAREDGAYGGIGVSIPNPADGADVEIESILDLDDPNLHIYEAHYAVTRDWAATLQILHGDDFVLSFNRMTGDVLCTVGDFLLADGDGVKKAACKGAHHETFHFALNNTVVKDNRIPPYGMRFDDAQIRNIVPVGSNQYGNPAAGEVYNYWDDVDLNVPSGAVYATIDLLYQGTSWEYIQFLNLANDQQNAFLGQEGVNMLEAWINAEVPVAIEVGGDYMMVPPVVMASISWGSSSGGNEAPTCSIESPENDTTIHEGESISYSGLANDSDGSIVSYLWSFPGGSPGDSTATTPGEVSYISAGSYTTTFSATDDGGESCAVATVTITVEVDDETVNCAAFLTRSSCSAYDSCKWSGKNKVCGQR